MPLSLGTIKVTLKCKTIIRVQIDFDAIVRKRSDLGQNIYSSQENSKKKVGGTVINVNPKIEVFNLKSAQKLEFLCDLEKCV